MNRTKMCGCGLSTGSAVAPQSLHANGGPYTVIAFSRYLSFRQGGEGEEQHGGLRGEVNRDVGQ